MALWRWRMKAVAKRERRRGEALAGSAAKRKGGTPTITRIIVNVRRKARRREACWCLSEDADEYRCPGVSKVKAQTRTIYAGSAASCSVLSYSFALMRVWFPEKRYEFVRVSTRPVNGEAKRKVFAPRETPHLSVDIITPLLAETFNCTYDRWYWTFYYVENLKTSWHLDKEFHGASFEPICSSLTFLVWEIPKGKIKECKFVFCNNICIYWSSQKRTLVFVCT